MKAVITGAGGMLGGALLRSSQKRLGFQVIPLTRKDADLRNRLVVKEVLGQIMPDVVLHTAARVGGIQANLSGPFEQLSENLAIDNNVIGVSAELGVRNLLYVGSSCMYPKDFRQPLIEEDILAARLEPSNEGYALAKIAGSKLCEYLSARGDFNYKTIVPSNLFGPYDNFHPSSSHLVASIIRKVYLAKCSGEATIGVWGTGKALREFTYVEDVANWIWDSAHDISALPPLLNLGSGTDHSVDEFYRMVMDAAGYRADLVHDSSKPEGMMAKLMDSGLAKSKHGWSPQTDIRDGIAKTYEWYVEHHA